MRRNIQITLPSGTLRAELNASQSADAIWDALPFEAGANVWGEEIYFRVPVDLPLAADARQVMERGELAYWPGGSAFCIFFGPTPVSQGQEPRAYTDVNPFGHIQDDLGPLRGVAQGDLVQVRRATEED